MWFIRKEVRLDHIEPVGSLKSSEDVAEWLKRLTPEDPKAFQVICESCHQKKTNLERRKPQPLLESSDTDEDSIDNSK